MHWKIKVDCGSLWTHWNAQGQACSEYQYSRQQNSRQQQISPTKRSPTKVSPTKLSPTKLSTELPPTKLQPTTLPPTKFPPTKLSPTKPAPIYLPPIQLPPTKRLDYKTLANKTLANKIIANVTWPIYPMCWWILVQTCQTTCSKQLKVHSILCTTKTRLREFADFLKCPRPSLLRILILWLLIIMTKIWSEHIEARRRYLRLQSISLTKDGSGRKTLSLPLWTMLVKSSKSAKTDPEVTLTFA